MINSFNAKIRVAAGGTHLMMFMRSKNYEYLQGTALCDYKSKIDHDNGYKCEACPYGSFSVSIKDGCISCA